MELSFSMFALCCGVTLVSVVLVYLWRFFRWVWLKPKAMDKFLRDQGLNGTPYKFLFGDMKKMLHMTSQAKLTLIKLTDSIVPRVMPFFYASAKTYGTYVFVLS